MNVPFTVTPDSISIFLDGRMRILQKSHMNFAAVASAIKNLARGTAQAGTIDRLRQLIDVPSFIATVTEGRVQVAVGGEVRFDGQPLHNYATQRLQEMLRDGFDIRPLARFLDRLANNPYAKEDAKEELYRFLERGNMPLTEDGCFLAFKRVRADFASINTGPGGEVTYNLPGTRVEFPRDRLILEERGRTCSSSGLHVCSFGYLTHFHPGAGNKVVVVKCAPEELWSVPEGEDTKCQMVAYEVLREVPEDEVKHLFEGVGWTDAHGGAFGPEWYYGDDDPCGDDEAPHLEDVEQAERDAEAHGHPVTDVKDDLQARLKAQNKAFKSKHGVTLDRIRKLVRKHGQREASRQTGVPRTTIRRWLAATE